jgi:hypothetical protein
MTISTINIGTIANDGTGDDLREAFIKVNSNFTVLNDRSPAATTVSNRIADSSTVAGVFFQKQGVDLQFKSLESGNNITLTATDDKITIAASGIISLGIVGNTGPVETLGNNQTLQVLGTASGATRTEMINSNTLRITSLLSNETTPTLGATLNGANNSITGVNVLQATNVQSLVYGIDVDDRNSFIGFDMGSIQLDNSNAETVTNLLDYIFFLNPVDLGVSLSTTSTTGTGSVATIGFATQASAPFALGSQITVLGVTPVGYNGTHIVTACTTSSVSFANTTTAVQTVAGVISAVTTNIDFGAL